MATIDMHQATTSTPSSSSLRLPTSGRGVRALGQQRAGVSQGEITAARLTPTSQRAPGGVWERLHDDWSDPNRVVTKTTDSNLWGGRSGHTDTITRRPDGTTDVDAVGDARAATSKGDARPPRSGPSASAFW